ncbi:MAG: WD40 repeat domain-containing protein, partial [Planctomycetota bacterium]
VLSLAFSPDGKTLASGAGDRSVKLWDVATGEQRATLKGHVDWVASVAFSPNGKILASSSHDKTIRLWRAASEEDVRAATELDGSQFSPNHEVPRSESPEPIAR